MRFLNLHTRFGKHSIGANADVTYRNYSDIANMNTWTQQYGVNALISITPNLQLSTDFQRIHAIGL